MVTPRRNPTDPTMVTPEPLKENNFESLLNSFKSQNSNHLKRKLNDKIFESARSTGSNSGSAITSAPVLVASTSSAGTTTTGMNA